MMFSGVRGIPSIRSSSRGRSPSSARPRRPAASAGRCSATSSPPRSAGVVHPVNPRRETVLGLKSYPAVGDVPGPIDLAVVVTPARDGARDHPPVRPSGRAAPRSIISAGFRETGPAGAELEAQRVRGGAPGRHAHRRPELPGRHEPDERPQRHLRRRHRRPGRVAFLSQSGALLTAILDWSAARAGRLPRVRVDRLDARRRLGRPHRLLRRRSRARAPSSSTWSRSAMRGRSCRRRARWR